MMTVYFINSLNLKLHQKQYSVKPAEDILTSENFVNTSVVELT